MVETNKPANRTPRKPRPSPKGTGKDTGCLHTSVILPKDVADAVENLVWIHDEKGNRIGKRTGVSANDIVVTAVRKDLGLPIPNVGISITRVEPDPATAAFANIKIPSNQ